MRNIKIVGLMVLLLLLGGMVYSEVSSAKKTLLDAFENTTKSKSYRMEATVTTEITSEGRAPMKIDSTVKEVSKRPDLSYVKAEVMGMQMEIYQQGKNRVMKSPMTGKWEKMTKQEEGFMPMPLELMNLAKGYIKEAKFVGEEKIRGEECQTIETTLATEELNEIKKKLKIPLPPDAQIKVNQANLKVWVDKAEGFLYRASLSLAATIKGKSILPMPLPTPEPEPGKDDEDKEEKKLPEEGQEPPQTMTLQLSLEVNWSDYNQDLEIEIPAEAKKVMESGEEKEE